VNRKHLVSLGLAACLCALVAWIARNTYWQEIEVPTSFKGEALTNPFYAAQHFAESLGARSQWRHEVIALPPRHAIIVTGIWNWNLIPSRRERLEQWVAAGGRLVVDDGLTAGREFKDWTGVTRLPVEPEKNNTCTPAEPCRNPRQDLGTRHNNSFGICNLAGFTRFSTGRAVSWALRDKRGNFQVLRIRIGRGSVTLINARPFGNSGLLCGNDASLFTAATQLRRGDEICFLSEADAAPLLLLLWSYGSPVVVLAALLIALWLWRSGARFGPLLAAPALARRSLAEQIRGTGQFTLRFGGGGALYIATARALREAAERHIAHYERLSGEERIATLARVTGLGSSELSDALDYSGPRRPNDLRRTIAVLESARRIITTTKTTIAREGSGHAD
jgi:hypothetical protein